MVTTVLNSISWKLISGHGNLLLMSAITLVQEDSTITAIDLDLAGRTTSTSLLTQTTVPALVSKSILNSGSTSSLISTKVMVASAVS